MDHQVALTALSVSRSGEALGALVEIARQRPQWIREAGGRVAARVDRAFQEELDAVTARRVGLLEDLEFARQLVLCSTYDATTSTGTDLGGYVEVIAKFESDGGDLQEHSAMDAYSKVTALQAFEDEGGRDRNESCPRPVSSIEELRLSIRESLDPGHAADAVPPFVNRLCAELQAMMRRWGQRTWTRDEVVEAAVIVLCVEYTDMSGEDLGFGRDLPIGRWDHLGDESIHGHREGMLYYLDREGGAAHRELNDRKYWSFVGEIAARARAFLLGDPEVSAPVEGERVLAEDAGPGRGNWVSKYQSYLIRYAPIRRFLDSAGVPDIPRRVAAAKPYLPVAIHTVPKTGSWFRLGDIWSAIARAFGVEDHMRRLEMGPVPQDILKHLERPDWSPGGSGSG